jgi:hypothetical protein
MTLNQHVAITGVAAAVLLSFWSKMEVALFCAGGILIDVDHYLCYIQRTGRFGIAGMFRYFQALCKIEQGIPYYGLCLFHTVDFFLLVALAAFYYPVFIPLLTGLLFHFAVDLCDLLRKKVPFIRAYFLIEHLIRRRQKGYPFF